MNVIKHPSAEGLNPERQSHLQAISHRPVEINEYDLPVVATLVYPDHTEGAWLNRAMIDSLAADPSMEARWALEMIESLQRQVSEQHERLRRVRVALERES